MRNITNQEIARVLFEISEYLEMQDVPFKPRAYEKVAEVVGDLEEEISAMYASGGIRSISSISGVGASIAEIIEELIKTGKSKYHQQLKKKTPVDLATLTRVEGLGPKNIKKLYQELGIKTLADLENSAKKGKIGKLDGFGEKSEQKILKGIKFVKKSGGRFILGFTSEYISQIEKSLKKLKEVEKITIAGSARRKKETIGDLDILIVSKKPGKVMDYFVAMQEVAHVYAHGNKKSMVKLKNGMDADLRVVPAESYGAALNYFTGSKDHNVALRELAIKKGWKLNEYGLFRGKKKIAGRTEADLYKKLGMDYIEPEMRENTGETEIAKRHNLPKLVGYGELVGDLQVQTNWTDGVNSIEEMAKAAMRVGLKYIAITDHTKRLAMTGGLDEKKIVKQWKEINAVNKKLGGKFKILKGSECDILKDGSLDLADSTLEKLDIVGASVHSYFNISRKEQTERVKRAMSNPHVDIVFHPTGRLIERRPPYDIDMDEIIRTAKKTNTVLEVDAFPDRLDLKDEYIRKCVDSGVKMVINSDAHSVNHFEYLEWGVSQARRGWAEKKDIINAWPVEKMLRFLKNKK